MKHPSSTAKPSRQTVVEEQLRQSREALINSEEMFYKIFEHSPDSVLITRSDDGILLDVNQTFLNLTGYSYDDVIGKTVNDLNFRCQTDEFRNSGGQETVFRAKDGRLIPVVISETVVDICGKTVVLSIARDISQKKRMEQEILKAKEAAETASRAKSDFLATMSHEIRTPMNVILGFSEILLNSTDDAKEKSYLSNIYSSGKVLLSIINDILDLTKIEAGKLEIQPDLVNIRDLLSETELIFSQKIEEKGLRFIMDISPDVPEGLMMDEIRIRQILINLIGNAVKFTLQGHIKVSVACPYVNPASGAARIIFRVEDTGIGVSDDQIRWIFESFHQQKGQKVKQYGGSGLGLSITKKLVELMNGQITVTSDVGKGAVFCVKFEDVEIVDIAYDTISLSAETKEYVFQPSTLLITDDSMSNRGLIRAFMENTGVTVIEAENGVAAVSMLENNPAAYPDLILMDLLMPEKDGYETLEMLKNNNQLKHIPVIAFTALAMKEEEKRIRSVFNGYLPKPVSKDQLYAELRKFLPYTETTAESHDVSEPAAIEIPDRLQDRLPDLLQELNDRYIPLLIEIEDGYFFDDIELFANDLLRISDDYQFDYLKQFSRQLLEYIRANQVDEMERMIKNFPSVLDTVQRGQDRGRRSEDRSRKAGNSLMHSVICPPASVLCLLSSVMGV